jgi:hypothetical protein
VSFKGRTKIGLFMTHRINHQLPSHLEMHYGSLLNGDDRALMAV